MATWTYGVEGAAEISVVECEGNLTVVGWNEPAVEISASCKDDELNNAIAQEGNRIAIDRLRGNLRLRVPQQSALFVKRVSGSVELAGIERAHLLKVDGDLSAESLAGLEVEEVSGDLTLDTLGTLVLGKARGDVSIKGEQTTATLGQVSGDLRASATTGPLKVGKVSGDAHVDGWAAGLELGIVRGDLTLRLTPEGSARYRANVSGDARVELGQAANLSLKAIVKGDISGIGAGPEKRSSAGTVSATFGAGGPELDITVSGDLLVSHGGAASSACWGWGPDMRGFAEEMGQLGHDLGQMARELGETFGGNFGGWASEMPFGRRGGPWMRPGPRGRHEGRAEGRPPFGRGIDPERLDRIKQRARRAAEAGVSQAQEVVERVLREVNANVKGDQRGPAPVDPVPPVPATGATVDLSRQKGVSDEERLAILRMLQQGKISPEEADMLLSALDG